VGCCSPSTVKNETCPPKMTRGFDCRNTRTLFSFFLCRLKLRYAFLQNSNSAFEVIYCTARRVKFLLAFGRIFRNQFLEKSTLLCRQLVLRTLLFSIVQTSTLGTSCAHAVLVRSAMPMARTRGFRIITLCPRDHARRRHHQKRRLGRLRPASAITRLVNWGDFPASVESQEHALA
jgi:hypothetical protein